jgi:hypothetical protein
MRPSELHEKVVRRVVALAEPYRETDLLDRAYLAACVIWPSK